MPTKGGCRNALITFKHYKPRWFSRANLKSGWAGVKMRFFNQVIPFKGAIKEIFFIRLCKRMHLCETQPWEGCKILDLQLSSSQLSRWKRFYDSGKCQSRPEGSPLIYTFQLVHKTPCTLQPFMICKGGGWDFPIYSYHKRETNDQCSLVTTHCTLHEEFQPFVNVRELTLMHLFH